MILQARSSVLNSCHLSSSPSSCTCVHVHKRMQAVDGIVHNEWPYIRLPSLEGNNVINLMRTLCILGDAVPLTSHAINALLYMSTSCNRTCCNFCTACDAICHTLQGWTQSELAFIKKLKAATLNLVHHCVSTASEAACAKQNSSN